MTPILPADPNDPADGAEMRELAAVPELTHARDAKLVLSPRQRIAVWELANGSTKDVAAARAKCSTRIIYQWLRMPHIRAALDEACAMVRDISTPTIEAGRAYIADHTVAMAKRLVELATDEEQSPMVQLAAIRQSFEALGLAGKGATVTTAVQVNVHARVEDDIAEAERILAERSR